MRNLFASAVVVLCLAFAVPVSGQRDNYPFRDYCPAASQETDPWGFKKCSDESYAAYRLNAALKAMHQARPFFDNSYLQPDGREWGEASGWKSAAARAGDITGIHMVKPDRPAPGDVAWFQSGRVAFVESVYPDGSVSVSEYDEASRIYRTRSKVEADAYLSIFQHHEYCRKEGACLNFETFRSPAPPLSEPRDVFAEKVQAGEALTAGAQPNLYVSSLDVGGGKYTFSPKEKFLIRAVVTNDGESTSQDVTLAYFLVSSGPVKLLKVQRLGEIAAGRTMTGRVSYTAPSSPGDYSIMACADVYNSIAEATEADNCYAAPFEVKKGDDPPPDPGTTIPYKEDFDTDQHYYELQDNLGAATMSVDETGGVGNGRCLYLYNTKAGQSWQVEAKKKYFYLQNARQYAGSVWLKADRPGKVNLTLSRDVEPYDSFGLYFPLGLSTQWRQYFFDFKTEGHPELKPEQVRFSINLGEYAGKLWIDKISLDKFTPTALPYFENFSGDVMSCKLFDRLNFAAITLSSAGGVDKSQCLKVANKKRGEFWQVQVRKAGLDLKPKTVYTGSVAMRADAKAKIMLCVSREVEPWDNLGLYKEVIVDRSWKTFKFEFTTLSKTFSPEDIGLQICLGLFKGKLYIDNVSIRKKEADNP